MGEAAGRGEGASGVEVIRYGNEPEQLLSPVELLPIGVPVELVHGRLDTHVPPDQSHRYEAAARVAGDPVTLTEVAGKHFAIIDAATEDWAACVAAARRLLG